jgi:hypothetical protein
MGAAGILGVALSIGATVMALSFALGHVSGGRFKSGHRPRRRRARQRQQRGRLYHRQGPAPPRIPTAGIIGGSIARRLQQELGA